MDLASNRRGSWKLRTITANKRFIGMIQLFDGSAVRFLLFMSLRKEVKIMASVIKYKDGYAVRLDIPSEAGTRKQKFISGFFSPKEAKAAMIQLQAEVQSESYKTPCELTVAAFADIWLSDHASQLAPKTRDYYKYMTRYVVKHLGRIRIEDLKANQIERMYRNIRSEKELNPNTIHHVHKTLRSMLNTAVRWDYIDSSPIPKVTAPKKKKPQLEFWDVDEIQKGLAALEGTTIHYHATVSLYTGLRLGEVCGLREEDINFDKNYFTVCRTLQSINGEVITKAPKTEKSNRRIPMNSEVASLLHRRLQQIRENRMRYRDKYDETWLGYLSVYDTGEIQSDQTVGRKWRKLMGNINIDPLTEKPMTKTDPRYIKPIRFHDLRHSCASWLLYIGADLKEIQEILGHSAFSVTADIYAHLCEKVIKTSMDKMILGR